MNPKPVNNKATPAKMRFVPKATQRRAPKSVIPKKEEIEDADAIQAKDLLRRFSENSIAKRRNSDTKVASSQVTFGFGGESKSIRSYRASSSADVGTASCGVNVHKEYKEPWDYYSNYPTTLPIRRPYSGDPEILNEEEFGMGSECMDCDENSTNQAIDLGLMDESLEKKMIYFQLPTMLPMVKRSSSSNSDVQNGRLDDLPEGLMGKMLVYKSGAVKLKLGDSIYDVSTGLDCIFAQDVVAINTKEKHCCGLGEVTKRAVVTPDVDSLLDSFDD